MGWLTGWLNGLGWLGKSFLSCGLFVPVWFAIVWAGQRGVRSEVIAFCYSLFCVVGLAYLIFAGPERYDLVENLSAHRGAALIVGMFGLVVGTYAVVVGYGGVRAAPNGGLAATITNMSPVIVAFLLPFVARALPKLFKPTEFDWRMLMGVALMAAGALITVYYGKKA